MSRDTRAQNPYYAMAVKDDGELVRYHAQDVVTVERMEEVVGPGLVLINHGYDPVTDSFWPTFRHASVTAERARDLIRQWNAANPDEIFPSVSNPA